MTLSKRLKTLEDRLTIEPVTLCFADGSTAVIPARVHGRDHILQLLASAVSGERSRELDLLAASSSCEEPRVAVTCVN